jgi:hypothetical protein
MLIGSVGLATGNGDWNGRTNWGDSTVHLSADASHVLGSWTPTVQAELQSSDLDLGSTSPVLLGGGSIAQGGKDGKIRLLSLTKLSPPGRTGGELQTISTPGATDLFTAPAVWHADGRTWLFVADNAGLAALDARRWPPSPRVVDEYSWNEPRYRRRPVVRLRSKRRPPYLPAEQRQETRHTRCRRRTLEQRHRRRRPHRASRRRRKPARFEWGPRHLPSRLGPGVDSPHRSH